MECDVWIYGRWIYVWVMDGWVNDWVVRRRDGRVGNLGWLKEDVCANDGCMGECLGGRMGGCVGDRAEGWEDG